MNTCDYAACNRVATEKADGWHFCRHHLRHHEALKDDRTPPGPLLTFGWESTRQPCGTAAAYQRHLRAGQKPCHACTEAQYRRRHAA